MIVWINGAFGVGKTTVARRLVTELSDAMLFDPEWVGFVVQRFTRQGRNAADFQDVGRWRAWTVRSISLATHFCEHLVVPMTLVDQAYFAEIVGALRERGDVRHFALTGSPDVIRERLCSRRQNADWAEARLSRCVNALEHPIFAQQIPTDGRSVEEIVIEIRQRLIRSFDPRSAAPALLRGGRST